MNGTFCHRETHRYGTLSPNFQALYDNILERKPGPEPQDG